MILRPAVAGDRDGVVQLALHFHHDTPYAELLTVDPARIGAQFDVALATGVVIVAERDTVPPPAGPELVGFLALAVCTHMLSGDRYGEEMGWWVEPSYRSGTLGPRLLRWAEDWARQHGCVFLRMGAPAGQAVYGRPGSTFYEQTTLMHFYEQLGYRPIETSFLKRVA